MQKPSTWQDQPTLDKLPPYLTRKREAHWRKNCQVWAQTQFSFVGFSQLSIITFFVPYKRAGTHFSIHPAKRQYTPPSKKSQKSYPLVSFKRILCQAAEVLLQKPPAVHWLPFEANVFYFILQIKRGSIKASQQSSKHLTNPFGSFPGWKLEKMLGSSSAVRVAFFAKFSMQLCQLI